MKNWKDILSNLAAWLIALGMFLAGINIAALHLPEWVTLIGGLMVGLGGVITSVVTGKNPNLTAKTQTQVNELNAEQKATKEVK